MSKCNDNKATRISSINTLLQQSVSVLPFPGLEIKYPAGIKQSQHQVFQDGEEVNPTRLEYGTLVYLSSSPGIVFTQTQIIETVSVPPAPQSATKSSPHIQKPYPSPLKNRACMSKSPLYSRAIHQLLMAPVLRQLSPAKHLYRLIHRTPYFAHLTPNIITIITYKNRNHSIIRIVF